MRLTVLNPKGRDPEQMFPNGPGSPGDVGHAPINFHAFAACTRGSFHTDTARALATGDPILVLIRRKQKRTLAALRECKAKGRTTIISWKETGLQQVEDQLKSASAWRLFREIAQLADGCLSATEELLPVYRAASPDTPAIFLPTPYPVESSEWNFERPLGECHGIFLGTRRFKHRERCHQLALSQVAALAHEIQCRVTVINPEGRSGEERIRSVGIPDSLLRIRPPLAYPDYLRLMAQHRLVFQRDHRVVPGQVAGDAVLCRIPCVGGSGAVDRIAFPGWCSGDASGEQLLAIARDLLVDDDLWLSQRDRISIRSEEQLSYRTIATRLEAFVADPATSASPPQGQTLHV